MRDFPVGRQVAIDSQGGEQGADRLQHGVDQQQNQSRNHRQFVRPDVSQQAPHQTPVVGFS